MNERRASRGFTLVELVAILGLVGVVLLIALPNLQQMQTRNRLLTPLRDIERLTSLARLQAVNHSSHAVVAFLQDNVSTSDFASQSYDRRAGVVTFLDANNNDTWDAGETISGRYELPSAAKFLRPGGATPTIDAPGARVVYSASGNLTTATPPAVYLGDGQGNFVRLLWNPTTGQVERQMYSPATSSWLGVGKEAQWPWAY
jgi:Tfp pilus assembly protein FimT